MNYAIGVDIGGTNIRMAIVSNVGEIVKVIKTKTKPTKSPDELVDQIVNLYNEIGAKEYNVVGMGIGVPGPVEQNSGYVYVLSNIGIADFNLKQLVEQKLNIPVVVGNDANLAAYAEAMLGGGRGHKVVQFITVSTGIGGGLVINGQIISGRMGFAQEIGNMIVDQRSKRKQNAVMASGSFEALCSGTAIVNMAKEAGIEVEHAGELFALASQGVKEAIKIKKNWLKNMGIAIANMVDYIEPDMFILGGGVIQSSEHFMDELKKEIDKNIFKQLRGNVNITSAEFDQDAGIIGCALISFR